MVPLYVTGCKSERLVVKSTFLDFDDGHKHRQLFRSLSDSSLFKTTSLPEYRPGSSRPFSTNLGSVPSSPHLSEGLSASSEADSRTASSRPSSPSVGSRPSPPHLTEDLSDTIGSDISTAASRQSSPSGADGSTAASAPDGGPARHHSGGRQREQGHEQLRTTLMLRNLPNNYTRTMLLTIFDRHGLAGTYNFVYVPMDFDRRCNLGYAFVNLVDAALMPRFSAALDGFSRWAVRSHKVCQVVWSERDQGLKANVRRYQNSSVMHPDVPDEYRPCLFSGGMRVPFPAPRKQVPKPVVHRG